MGHEKEQAPKASYEEIAKRRDEAIAKALRTPPTTDKRGRQQQSRVSRSKKKADEAS